jgi:predicted AAA+ superfamily ATPase
MLEVLARWNRWGSGRMEPGIDRDLTDRIEAHLGGPEVLSLVGPRRAGKTTVLFQVADRLERSGVPSEAVLHVNFEEPLLSTDLGPDLMEKLYTTYREEVFPQGRAYLMLDEVQNVHAWERWVRARCDTEDVKVLVTGSSSALMSREFGTRLTGRHLTFPVQPLGFQEFLRFRDVPLPKKPSLAGSPPRIQKALSEYLTWGGFPEVTLAADESRKSSLLKQYFDDVLFKDVALRHRIRDLATLRALAVHLLTQTAGLVTYQRLSRVFGVSLDLVRSYCSHLEESFLVAFLPQYSLKASERQRNPQKVHAGDLGLRNAVCISGSSDLGRRAETAAFQALWRLGSRGVYHWRGSGGEVDLLVRRKNRVASLVQVVYAGVEDEAVRKRELRSLDAAAKRFKKASRRLVVGRLSGAAGSKIPAGIDVLPLWRFLVDLGSSTP